MAASTGCTNKAFKTVLLLVWFCSSCTGFLPSQTSLLRPLPLLSKSAPLPSLKAVKTCRPRLRGAQMVLGPIGPFVPFRSSYCESQDVDDEMMKLTLVASDLSVKFQAISTGLQSGVPPNPTEVETIAQEMEKANEQWSILLTRFQLSEDFQALQLFKMTEARLAQNGINFAQMKASTSWQVQAMLAYASGKPPPPMPAEVQKIMSQSSQESSQIMSQGMMSSSGVTALPFKEGSKAIQSPVVQEEFRQMVAEHKSLVKLGEGYGKWDRTGKLMYIDQMEAIEDRWGIFMKRFELMGEMNPEFVLQRDEYLKRLQIKNEQEFINLLEETRRIMRADAERT